MDEYLMWGLGLLGASLLLVVLEVFLPSGGVIAVASVLTAVAGVVALFIFDTLWGVVGLLGTVILAPIVFFGGLNVWRNTPIGRRMIGAPSDEELERQRREENAAVEARLAMLGSEGVAVTALRPVGVVRIDGQRHDAQAEISFIEPGDAVRVTHVDRFQMKVRAVKESEQG
ncbi:MAG: hypothetical protein H6811_06640 [Phycisphaeraceae bacterium]|nr:hypothetical protein [Phycisphaeraceae bacterium]